MIELNFQKKKSCSGVTLPKFCEKWMWVIFCMKLQQQEVLKLTEIIFFDKNLTSRFLGKRRQNEVYGSYEKLMLTTFLVFVMKLQYDKVLRLN